MAVALQSPLRIIGTIHRCLRKNFSTSFYVYDDNNSNNKQSPPQSNSPPAPQLRPSQLASSSIRSPAYSSIDQATRSETVLKLIDDILGGAIGGTPKSRRRKDSHSFQPASMSTMPLAANAIQKPMALPSRPISEQRPGYIHIHAVSMTKNIHITSHGLQT